MACSALEGGVNEDGVSAVLTIVICADPHGAVISVFGVSFRSSVLIQFYFFKCIINKYGRPPHAPIGSPQHNIAEVGDNYIILKNTEHRRLGGVRYLFEGNHNCRIVIGYFIFGNRLDNIVMYYHIFHSLGRVVPHSAYLPSIAAPGNQCIVVAMHVFVPDCGR